MTTKNFIEDVLIKDISKDLIGGLNIPIIYLLDTKLNSSRKILLSVLLYIEDYYGNKIIQVSYLNRLTGIDVGIITNELKRLESLGYVESKLEFNGSIAIGKRFYLKIKP